MTSILIGFDKQKNEGKIVNIFSSINLNISFDCSEEPSPQDVSFKYHNIFFVWVIRIIIFNYSKTCEKNATQK